MTESNDVLNAINREIVRQATNWVREDKCKLSRRGYIDMATGAVYAWWAAADALGVPPKDSEKVYWEYMAMLTEF